jgi:hypothetical protein
VQVVGPKPGVQRVIADKRDDHTQHPQRHEPEEDVFLFGLQGKLIHYISFNN